MEINEGGCLAFLTVLLESGLSWQGGPRAGLGLHRGPRQAPRTCREGSSTSCGLTSSSRVGMRKEMRSHSRAESQKVATWTPLTNWTCLAWTALSLTARMENVLAKNAMAKSKLRAISNPFRPLRGWGGQGRSGIEHSTSGHMGDGVLGNYHSKHAMQVKGKCQSWGMVSVPGKCPHPQNSSSSGFPVSSDGSATRPVTFNLCHPLPTDTRVSLCLSHI